MLHPIKEWHDDPISAGWFYGSITEGGAVSSLLLRGLLNPAALLTLVGALVVAGAVVVAGGFWNFNHRPERTE